MDAVYRWISLGSGSETSRYQNQNKPESLFKNELYSSPKVSGSSILRWGVRIYTQNKYLGGADTVLQILFKNHWFEVRRTYQPMERDKYLILPFHGDILSLIKLLRKFIMKLKCVCQQNLSPVVRWTDIYSCTISKTIPLQSF